MNHSFIIALAFALTPSWCLCQVLNRSADEALMAVPEIKVKFTDDTYNSGYGIIVAHRNDSLIFMMPIILLSSYFGDPVDSVFVTYFKSDRPVKIPCSQIPIPESILSRNKEFALFAFKAPPQTRHTANISHLKQVQKRYFFFVKDSAVALSLVRRKRKYDEFHLAYDREVTPRLGAPVFDLTGIRAFLVNNTQKHLIAKDLQGSMKLVNTICFPRPKKSSLPTRKKVPLDLDLFYNLDIYASLSTNFYLGKDLRFKNTTLSPSIGAGCEFGLGRIHFGYDFSYNQLKSRENRDAVLYKNTETSFYSHTFKAYYYVITGAFYNIGVGAGAGFIKFTTSLTDLNGKKLDLDTVFPGEIRPTAAAFPVGVKLSISHFDLFIDQVFVRTRYLDINLDNGIEVNRRYDKYLKIGISYYLRRTHTDYR